MSAKNSFLPNDRVLIAGGTGFIGRHLARRCLRETAHVTSLGFMGEPAPGGGAENPGEIIYTDLTKPDLLAAALNGRSFEYVFNAGGFIDHTHYFKGGRRVIESHFIGLMNLLDCLDRSSLKGFVQVGSSDEYGNAAAPQSELMKEMPISPYSFAKVAATHLIQTLSRTEGFPGSVVRFFLVYGPGQDTGRFIPQIITACIGDKEFKTSEGRQLRDFCYIGDIMEGMIAAAVRPKARGEVFNIASGQPVPIRDMVKKIVAFTGGGKPLWGSHPYRVGENMALYADIGKAENLLGWRPTVSLEDGLKQTIDYYRNQHK